MFVNNRVLNKAKQPQSVITRLSRDFYDELLGQMREREKHLERVALAWAKGDISLVLLGLALESLADGRLRLRVRAGPFWADDQAGAGPCLCELPPLRVVSSEADL
jgi:hypothetical protein